jgi:non-specific serine/threonine protein kinase/protein-serine/threonine kinase
MLYEMLTLKVPFAGDNVYAALRAKVEDDPVPPRDLRPEIPPVLEEIILHAIEPEPHERPQSAFELREALAHPASVIMRNRAGRRRFTRRLSRRTRRIVGLASAVVAYALILWALSRAG